MFHPRIGKEHLPPHWQFDMKINLKEGSSLTVGKLYELSPDQMKAQRLQLERELKAGRIIRSNSSYGAPTFMVAKSTPGEWRMVVDYRSINAATIGDAYPLPLISQITNNLSKSSFYTSLDLVGAYQLLRMSEGHESHTAFQTHFGMFESKVLRDGLKNAPAAFQHFIHATLSDLLGKGVVVYIDDILIHAPTVEELRRLTREVLTRLESADLFCNAKKCRFEQDKVKFLGFMISSKGIRANKDYVSGISNFPAPRSLRQTQRFVGMAGYYRRFIPGFSNLACPLTSLTRKDVVFQWGPPQQQAFELLKKKLLEAPVLAHYDPTFETIIQTDASDYGWGFIISQIDSKNQEHPITIKSGSFKGAESNYTTTEKEFLAIVMAFRRKRHLLLQVTLTILTDHNNLAYWMSPRQLNSRQARWVDLLAEFSFRIVYRPGSKAVFPDALS